MYRDVERAPSGDAKICRDLTTLVPAECAFPHR